MPVQRVCPCGEPFLITTGQKRHRFCPAHISAGTTPDLWEPGPFLNSWVFAEMAAEADAPPDDTRRMPSGLRALGSGLLEGAAVDLRGLDVRPPFGRWTGEEDPRRYDILARDRALDAAAWIRGAPAPITFAEACAMAGLEEEAVREGLRRIVRARRARAAVRQAA